MVNNIFYNKTCFISGATGGIGSSIAREMAKLHCNLFLVSTSIEKINALKRDLESYDHAQIKYEIGDLNNVEDLQKIIHSAREHFEKIDILINCAGVFLVKNLDQLTLNDYETTFNINLRSVIFFCKEFAQDMIQCGWGRIVNIGSSSAYLGFKETSLYCASKHALLGFSRAIYDELKEQNIRVFSISPGSVKTPMGQLVQNQNFETFINPDEIAEYVTFVLAFDSEMISEEIQLNRVKIE